MVGKINFGRVFLLCVLLFCLIFNIPSEAKVSKEEAARIKAAVPSKSTAVPKKPRKLLVFSLCRSYVHSSIPYGKKVLEIMGKKTGAFEAVFSDDISVFEPESLKQFDAVFFNNNSGELFLPADVNSLPEQEQTVAKKRNAELEKSLADYIRDGGGFAGIHCAVWCFYDWAEYANIIGATWVSHPWHEKVSIKLDDAEHPLCAAFGGKGFDITDEIYVFTEPYSRKKVRVLFSLDMNKIKAKEEFEGKRADGDYAQSWVKKYGKGRVFYSALGHDHDIFWNEAVLQHWLDGIQFALGDLEVDTTPK